ncbi:hypothetical protein [Actinomycetospora sp. CA-053990]|uniref:hypothetical protein n=1 Tax=Actinomycetospora sp. CA-053990 TaxID=3239891 RepID=UPI003D90EB54
MSRPADPAVRGGALAVAAGALGLAVILAVPAAAATPTPGESWSAEIALEGGDDQGVVLTDGAVRLDGVPNGEVVLAPRRTLGLVDGIAGVPAVDVPAAPPSSSRPVACSATDAGATGCGCPARAPPTSATRPARSGSASCCAAPTAARARSCAGCG